MIRPMRGTSAARLALWAACLACIGVVFAVTAETAGAAATTESEQAFHKQLAAGEIKSAQFRVKNKSLHLVLTDGRHVIVHLSTLPNKTLRAELKKHGVKVAKKSPPHKLRYILGGAAIVLLILIAVGLVFWFKRRRKRDEY